MRSGAGRPSRPQQAGSRARQAGRNRPVEGGHVRFEGDRFAGCGRLRRRTARRLRRESRARTRRCGRGEFFDEALVREIKEETNLDGAVGDFYEAIQDDYVHKRTVQVVMYLKNITGDISISDEHDNWMWANLEKIKTLELSTAFEKVLKKKNWKI